MLKFGGACDRTRRELEGGGEVVEESIIRNQYLRESSYSVYLKKRMIVTICFK